MPASRSRSLVLAVVCLALFMALLDSTAISLALPVIQADLRADVSGLQWIADGYVLVFACLLLSAGTLGDRLGRKRPFLGGLAVFTAGSVVCALAPSLGWLVTGRVLQGIGAAAVTPQTLAILAQTFPGTAERARAFGIWSGVSGLALLLGPAAGGLLVGSWGWQSIFWVNVPVGAVALALGARVLTDPERPAGAVRHSLDWPGQLLTIGCLAALTFALIEGGRYGWDSAPIVGAGIAGVLLAGALLAVERRAARPMLRLDLFRSGTFSACAAVTFVTAFGLYASFFLLSLFLQRAQGLAPAAAGVRLLPAMAAVVLVAPLAGVLAGRVGSRPVIVLGSGLAAGGLLALATVQPQSAYLQMWPALVALGAGIGFSMPATNTALMGSAPAESGSVAGATGETSQQVGALLGIAVLGALVSAGIHGSVRDSAAAPGLSGVDTGRLAYDIASGAVPVVPPGADPGAVARVAETALTAGVTAGLLVAGIGFAVGALVAAVAVREDRSAPAGQAHSIEPAGSTGSTAVPRSTSG